MLTCTPIWDIVEDNNLIQSMGEWNMFVVSGDWKAAYPGAAVGFLAMRSVANPETHSGLDRRKEELESQLRSGYGDKAALKAIPAIQAYNAYYKRFKKSYHVQIQLESVALKGRTIPRVAALVESMFMAELKNMLLTAGHDLDVVEPPVKVGVSKGGEKYVLLGGQEEELKPGDMMMSDGGGVISSVLYGPDRRTQIGPETRRVLFAVYAPPGIGGEAVRRHLQDIRDNVVLVSPEAEVEALEVYVAD